jgi:hypothetical protein
MVNALLPLSSAKAEHPCQTKANFLKLGSLVFAEDDGMEKMMALMSHPTENRSNSMEHKMNLLGIAIRSAFVLL